MSIYTNEAEAARTAQTTAGKYQSIHRTPSGLYVARSEQNVYELRETEKGLMWRYVAKFNPYATRQAEPKPPAIEAGSTVKLVTGINRVMHTPEIVEGKVSASGKTLSVEAHGDTYRLKTERLANGETEFRGSFYFEVYTPDAMQKNQRANLAPGPVAGCEAVSDTADLPAPPAFMTPYERLAARFSGTKGVALYTTCGKRLRLSVDRANALAADLHESLRADLRNVEAA